VAYCYRHGYVTEALEKGIGDATVAELVGHANTATIHRYYSHLTEKGDHLRAAAIRAAASPRTSEETRG
jgi:integrase